MASHHLTMIFKKKYRGPGGYSQLKPKKILINSIQIQESKFILMQRQYRPTMAEKNNN